MHALMLPCLQPLLSSMHWMVVVGLVSFPSRRCALSKVWDAAHHCQCHCWLLNVFSPLSAYLASLLQECSALLAV